MVLVITTVIAFIFVGVQVPNVQSQIQEGAINRDGGMLRVFNDRGYVNVNFNRGSLHIFIRFSQRWDSSEDLSFRKDNYNIKVNTQNGSLVAEFRGNDEETVLVNVLSASGPAIFNTLTGWMRVPGNRRGNITYGDETKRFNKRLDNLQYERLYVQLINDNKYIAGDADFFGVTFTPPDAQNRQQISFYADQFTVKITDTVPNIYRCNFVCEEPPVM